MEEFDKKDELDQDEDIIQENIPHTDIITGVFTEPKATFEKLANETPRTINWFMPVLLLIIAAIFSSFAIMSSSTIKMAMIEKQMSEVEKQFNEMVQKGQMTEQQANEQIERIREQSEGAGTFSIQMVFQAIGTFIFVFISFFVVSGVYYLFAKVIFKDEGTFSHAMLANGVTYYINILQIILMTILSLIFQRFFMGTSVGAFMDMDKSTVLGFVLGKLDIITIWALIVTSIALSKIFRSENSKKYYYMVFGTWLGWGILAYAIGTAVPFMRFLAQ